MLLSQKIAGFSKGDADVLRKAMGKKQISVLNKMKAQFISGATAKGHKLEILEKVWTDWEAFAQYAFNKSHSTCYAFVAYQTAYLKAHYPSEYMAAVLNHASDIDKITFFMEECKRMGIKVLGPDINESQKGFAVNARGEIRFGLGGLKGAGDNAVENIILERKQKGTYTDVFDFIKKVNQRAVNKKSLETLAYGGAFDCFTQFHRAQYFYLPEGEKTTGIEKMIAFGQATTQQETGNNNTLFGDLPNALDVPIPKIPNCEPWTLTEQLEHEKEVTGMFLSGHPLDHFRFELRHYGIMSLIDFNEFKDSVTLASSNQNRNFRIAGLVIDVQHRVTKTGKNFGSFVIEDFSSKTDFILWSEDYVKFQNYLEKGQNILINGYFRSRFNKSDQFEFKITTMCLLETVKQALTKNVEININPVSITPDFVHFFEKNIKNHPGKAGLKFNIYEPIENLKITLLAFEKGFEMNEEMADFLLDNPDLEVKVGLVG
jgi:DNA polymerase-3 subunit alpha